MRPSPSLSPARFVLKTEPENGKESLSLSEGTTLSFSILLSADGQGWFTVGHIDFPVQDPVQAGLHAIGMIDRTVYHGAYPEGTAIRFESFTLWR